jgi:hypothetical protein
MMTWPLAIIDTRNSADAKKKTTMKCRQTLVEKRVLNAYAGHPITICRHR